MALSDPYGDIIFEKRNIKITNPEGKVTFDHEIEFPIDFDDSHATIVASRYLCNNAKVKEKSLNDKLIHY